MLVETLSSSLRDVAKGSLGSQSAAAAAAVVTGIVAAVGTQPIEKKLVMDAMLQPMSSRPNPGIFGPLRNILSYQQQYGVRALWMSGLGPLLAREVTYVLSITAVGPWVSNYVMGSDHSQVLAGALSSFLVGLGAGIISAPCQTLNAMCKSERNRGVTAWTLFRRDIQPLGFQAGVHRLFFGATTRALRCGAATTLYFGYRLVWEIEHGL